MRLGVGIAVGIAGFVLYGALYYAAFSRLFGDFDLVMRLVLLGMLLSGTSFLVGFRLLEGQGAVLFAKALALPLVGTAALLIGMGAIMLISEHVLDILFVGLVTGVAKLYDLVNWVFFP